MLMINENKQSSRWIKGVVSLFFENHNGLAIINEIRGQELLGGWEIIIIHE